MRDVGSYIDETANFIWENVSLQLLIIKTNNKSNFAFSVTTTKFFLNH